MRRSILYYFALLAFTCVSCYEGEDLVETYNQYNAEQSIAMDASDISLTTAQVKVELHNPKFDSQITFYLTDQAEGDILTVGGTHTFIVADATHIIATEAQFKITGLMPDTKYRYVSVYTDVSGRTIRSEEQWFSTPGFEMVSSLRYRTYFECNVYTSFDNMIPGAEPGYIYGDQRNLTHENAVADIPVEYTGGTNAGCYETVGGFVPDTEFFLRPYIRYKGRIYYGPVESDRIPKIEVEFTDFVTEVISNQLIRLSSYARLQNVSTYYAYTLPELEYGMLIGNTPGVTFDNATQYVIEPNWLGGIHYEMTDIVPSQNYYARAYVRWQDQVFMSEEASFGIPKGELSGDVDWLLVDGQMMRFILVKAGTFMMGATEEQQAYARSDEYPAHEVTISKDYYISEIEVTKGMMKGSDDATPARPTYNEAVAFADRIGRLTGINSVSLPTEAEWEYAARGGHLHPEQTLYAGSNDPDEVAWVIDDPLSYDWQNTILPQLHQGGEKKPNALGIYDMSGNAAEWVLDAYQINYYAESPAADPFCAIDEWEKSGETDHTQLRVLRGGGARTQWYDPSLADYRVSARGVSNQGDGGFGFRIVIRNNK